MMESEKRPPSGQLPCVEKPWGFYIDYFRNDKVVFKKLVVMPDEMLSYQYHEFRDEVWYVESGRGLFMHGSNAQREDMAEDGITTSEEVNIDPDTWMIISKEHRHTVKCVSKQPLVIYEMQMGRPSEDDIVRLEDIYGRTEE